MQIYRQYCNGNLQVNFGRFLAGFWQNCLHGMTSWSSRESLNYPTVVESLTSKNPRHHLTGLNLSFASVSQGTAQLCRGHLVGLPVLLGMILIEAFAKGIDPAAPHPENIMNGASWEVDACSGNLDESAFRLAFEMVPFFSGSSIWLLTLPPICG